MLSVIILSVVKQNVIMLDVVMLSVIMLSVVMLSVVAPFTRVGLCKDVLIQFKSVPMSGNVI